MSIEAKMIGVEKMKFDIGAALAKMIGDKKRMNVETGPAMEAAGDLETHSLSWRRCCGIKNWNVHEP